jgi:hypothetical protein
MEFVIHKAESENIAFIADMMRGSQSGSIEFGACSYLRPKLILALLGPTFSLVLVCNVRRKHGDFRGKTVG